MVKIREAIVVEGRYDKNTLRQIVDTAVFTTEGFGVMNNKTLLTFLRTVAESRGLIILTDSDGAGFVIRNYLRAPCPKTGFGMPISRMWREKKNAKRLPARKASWVWRECLRRFFWKPCAVPVLPLRIRKLLYPEPPLPKLICSTGA